MRHIDSAGELLVEEHNYHIGLLGENKSFFARIAKKYGYIGIIIPTIEISRVANYEGKCPISHATENSTNESTIAASTVKSKIEEESSPTADRRPSNLHTSS